MPAVAGPSAPAAFCASLVYWLGIWVLRVSWEADATVLRTTGGAVPTFSRTKIGKIVKPVMLPPGRLRLATTLFDRVLAHTENNKELLSSAPSAPTDGRRSAKRNFRQLGAERDQPQTSGYVRNWRWASDIRLNHSGLRRSRLAQALAEGSAKGALLAGYPAVGVPITGISAAHTRRHRQCRRAAWR